MMRTIADIIAGERGVEGVQQLLAPTRIRPILRRMLQQPARLGACHLRRVKFKPGRKITAYYDLEVGALDACHSAQQPHDNALRSIAVTWRLPGASQTLPCVAGAWGAEIAERGLAQPFAQLIHAQPDAPLHVQVAPFDPAYGQLARLSDPTYVGELLHGYATAASQWQVTSIRYRPRQRHVLRYDAGCPRHSHAAATPVAQAQTTLFAKLYADGSSQCAAALTQSLAAWLAATTADVAVLCPLTYLPAERTMLYAQVPGDPLSAKLGEATPAADRALTRQLWQTGAALRRLHAAPAALTGGLHTHTLAQEVKAITSTCEHIVALLPAVGQQISSLLARAAAHYATLPQEAPTFVHGDFKADHVLVAANHLTLIDFDTCALADPALDIGKFLADLAWWYGAGPRTGLAQLRRAFLAGYGLAPTDPRLQRAQVWQALIGIKLMAHRVQLFDAQWATRTATVLQRVQAGFG